MKTGKSVQLSVFHPQYPTRNMGETYPMEQSFFYTSEFASKSHNAGGNQFWKGIFRRAILVLGVTAAAITGAYYWTTNQTPQYRGSFQLFIPPNYDAEESESLGNLPQKSLSFDSQVKLLQSPKLLTGVIDQIQTRYPEVTYSSLFNQTVGQTSFEADKLSIQPIKDTQILEVKYRDSEPQKIQFVLEKIAQSYLNFSRKDKPIDQNQENGNTSI